MLELSRSLRLKIVFMCSCSGSLLVLSVGVSYEKESSVSEILVGFQSSTNVFNQPTTWTQFLV